MTRGQPDEALSTLFKLYLIEKLLKNALELYKLSFFYNLAFMVLKFEDGVFKIGHCIQFQM